MIGFKPQNSIYLYATVSWKNYSLLLNICEENGIKLPRYKILLIPCTDKLIKLHG